MIKKINVDTFLKFLGQGISDPALVIGDDMERYVLKTQKVTHNGKLTTFDCMFLNELLSAQIAKYLKVPVPDVAIAHIDQAFLENDPEIVFVHRFQEGIHFASQELPETEENLQENYRLLMAMGKSHIKRNWKQFFNKIVNPEDIARIVAFDILIANFDRYDNTGNLLIANTSEGRKIYGIDHGHAFFGPLWDGNKIQGLSAPKSNLEYIESFVNFVLNLNKINGLQNANGLGEVFRAVEEKINLDDLQYHSFQDIVSMIEGINEEQVLQWLNNIPESWYVEKNAQVSYYAHYLLRQKDLVRHILQRLAERRAFTNFRGGALQWKEEKQAGTV